MTADDDVWQEAVTEAGEALTKQGGFAGTYPRAHSSVDLFLNDHNGSERDAVTSSAATPAVTQRSGG